MAEHRRRRLLPALPALEAAQPGQAHPGQPHLPHPVPGHDRGHHPAAHDCPARGDGHRAVHDPDRGARLLYLHSVEEQAEGGGQVHRLSDTTDSKVVHCPAN